MNTNKILIYFICVINYTTIFTSHFGSDKTQYIDWRGDHKSFTFNQDSIIKAYTNNLYGCNVLFVGQKQPHENIVAHMSHYRSDGVGIQANAALHFIQSNNIDINDPKTVCILFRMKNNDPEADRIAQSNYIGTADEFIHAASLKSMNEARNVKNTNVLSTIKTTLHSTNDPKIIEYPKVTELEDRALGINRSIDITLNPANILTYKIQNGNPTPVFREDIIKFMSSRK